MKAEKSKAWREGDKLQFPAEELPIVVIGAGVIGRRHAETILRCPQFRLAGIAEPAEAGKRFAEGLGVRCYDVATDLLDDVTPAAAIIATPNESHREMALACINRGVPAILEKPIAGSLDDATAIVRASEQSGVAVLVGHHRRYNPIIQHARALISEGLLGELTNVSVLYTFYKPPEYFEAAWRRQSGGGPVLINLIHEIDLVRHLCGEIRSVQALTSNWTRRFDVEDTAAVLIRLITGTLVTISLSDTAVTPWSWDLATGELGIFPPQPGPPVQTHFFCGTEGSLTLPTLERWSYRLGKSWVLPIGREAIQYERADPFLQQLHHFYRVIRDGETPLITASDGALTLRATLAIHEAASSGRCLALE